VKGLSPERQWCCAEPSSPLEPGVHGPLAGALPSCPHRGARRSCALPEALCPLPSARGASAPAAPAPPTAWLFPGPAAVALSQGTRLALWRGWGWGSKLRFLDFSISCHPYLHLVYKMEIFSFRKLYNT